MGMICRLICSLLLLPLGFALIGVAPGAGNNWMADLDGDLPLSQLSIPGSHDSGARFEPVPGTATCQKLSIAEQLAAGVRFLDVRCRHLDDAFTIHHGAVYQKLSFAEVIADVLNFLDAHPGETVIMSVMKEHTTSGATRSFEATFDSYTDQAPKRWWLESKVPKLEQARGRIVLFRRFSSQSAPKGIDASKWPNNTTFGRGKRLRVQDRYVVANNGDKWKWIESLLDEAREGAPETLFVNYTSGYRSGMFGIPNIPAVSNEINPKLETYFASHGIGRYGVVVMDFVDVKRASLIYESNIGK